MSYRDVTWGMTAAERALCCAARWRRLSHGARALLCQVVKGEHWHSDTDRNRELLAELDGLVYDALTVRAMLYVWRTREGLLLVRWHERLRRWITPRRIAIG